MAFDYKKEYKEFYLPPKKPQIVEIPKMNFLAAGTSPALQDKNGDFNVKVGFSEPRSDGDSNAKIATILEYGKSGQPAKPFLKPAQSSSRNACISTMKAMLDEEVEKI